MPWDNKRCSAMRTQVDLVSLLLCAVPSLHPRTSELLPPGPQVGHAAPLLTSPLLCSQPALGAVMSRMPDALERTQGLVKRAAGTLPHVCKVSLVFRLLLLLFVFSSAHNSLSLTCCCSRPAQRGSNKGVVMADVLLGLWDSSGHHPAPPSTYGQGRG